MSRYLWIAVVCDLEREEVNAIIKEVFVKFIELARRGREIKVDLKIGFLHAYPNGEICFENKSDETAI